MFRAGFPSPPTLALPAGEGRARSLLHLHGQCLPRPSPAPPLSFSLAGSESFEIFFPGPCSTTPALPGPCTAPAHPLDHTVSTGNYSALAYSSEQHIYTHLYLLCELAHGYEQYIPRSFFSALGELSTLVKWLHLSE